jgi:hypothetical protein
VLCGRDDETRLHIQGEIELHERFGMVVQIELNVVEDLVLDICSSWSRIGVWDKKILAFVAHE